MQEKQGKKMLLRCTYPLTRLWALFVSSIRLMMSSEDVWSKRGEEQLLYIRVCV